MTLACTASVQGLEQNLEERNNTETGSTFIPRADFTNRLVLLAFYMSINTTK